MFSLAHRLSCLCLNHLTFNGDLGCRPAFLLMLSNRPALDFWVAERPGRCMTRLLLGCCFSCLAEEVPMWLTSLCCWSLHPMSLLVSAVTFNSTNPNVFIFFFFCFMSHTNLLVRWGEELIWRTNTRHSVLALGRCFVGEAVSSWR